ncbi:uncharacterized protein LOC120898243 [Anopheles arabiensis]|nr:uncharacterized protein LOC120898243 [Anopheles arabiensis]
MALNLLTVNSHKCTPPISFLLILAISSVMLPEIICSQPSTSKVEKIVDDLFELTNEPLLERSCFTADDLTVMQAKRHYEQLIPHSQSNFEPLSDATATRQMEFISQLENRTIAAFNDSKVQKLMLIAFADAYGAFLFGYFIPVMKYSYYGGFVSYFVANGAIQRLRKYETLFRHRPTNWKFYHLDPSLFLSKVEPVNEKQLKVDDHNCHQSLSAGLLTPTLEIDVERQELLLISIPHYTNATVRNPKSKDSSRMLLNYYIEIVRCFGNKKDQLATFQRELSDWLSYHMEYILTNDTLLYPAFEGVLRITKSIEDARKLPKKSITKSNEHSVENDIVDEDDTAFFESSTTSENPTEMSTLKKLSIWTGCSLAVLLVVYIIFKMQQNRKIISNNRFTHGRRKTLPKRRASSIRKLPRTASEQEDITVYDRFKSDKINDSKIKTKEHRNTSIARFIKRIRPRSWKSGATHYKPIKTELMDVEANDDHFSPRQQRTPKSDDPEAGPSGLNRKQGPHFCRCISCIGKEISDQDSDESTTLTVRYSGSNDHLRPSSNKKTKIVSSE